jgi:hypothetical protein
MTLRPFKHAAVTRLLFTTVALAVAVALTGCTLPSTTSSASSLPASDADPRSAEAFVRPADLAATLAGTGEKPLLFHVGFNVLYRGGAIPGSRYAGPGQTSEGLASLATAVKDVPHERAIVIYCGCCPWDHCPNMGPAFKTLRELGFTNVRALYTPKNLETDWVSKGYPIEKPTL